MGRHREASLVLEEGSKMDPLNCQIRTHLEAATQGVLRDLLAGALSTTVSSLHFPVNTYLKLEISK